MAQPAPYDLYEQCSKCLQVSLSVATSKCPGCGYLPEGNVRTNYDLETRKAREEGREPSENEDAWPKAKAPVGITRRQIERD